MASGESLVLLICCDRILAALTSSILLRSAAPTLTSLPESREKNRLDDRKRRSHHQQRSPNQELTKHIPDTVSDASEGVWSASKGASRDGEPGYGAFRVYALFEQGWGGASAVQGRFDDRLTPEPGQRGVSKDQQREWQTIMLRVRR